MTRKIPGLAAAALMFVRSLCGQTPQTMNLTLEEALAKALKNNLNVAVELYTPRLAEESLSRAREAFLPRFELAYDSTRNENASYWWISGEGTTWSRQNNYSLTLAEAIPTGGSISVSLQNYKSDTNQPLQLINPRYGSTLRLDFTQPLLKDFGFKVARRQILLAEANLDISNAQLQNTMLETVYLVQEAYWNLVYAVESAKVRLQSLELGRDLLAKNRKEVEFGQLAPIEILNAEAVVAQREADLIQAESLIIRGEEVLKSMINLAAEGGDPSVKLVLVDSPPFVPVSVDAAEAIRTALDKRPDLRMQRKQVESKDLGVAVARNQMLPGLDLRVSYWSPGISGDRLIYAGNDIFSGIVIGTEKGYASDALRDAFKRLYNNWNIGLTLSVPLSALISRAEYAYAKSELGQNLARLKALEQQAALDVSDALRTIEANAKRITAYRLARELAEKTLDAEVRKLAVGLSTNYFVLDFQEKLGNARSAELRAKIDYILSVERLERAMGVGLERRAFKIR